MPVLLPSIITRTRGSVPDSRTSILPSSPSFSEYKFGIAEPEPGARTCPPGEIDLVVVPGVAFTAGGVRLGRGKGYYDRYLSQAEFRGVTVGVCYAHQLVGELPSEPHDVAVDCVVAE